MNITRHVLIALALLAAACSPPAAEDTAPVAEEAPASAEAAVAAENTLLLDALQPVLQQEIGQPISLTTTSSKVEGDWGWIVVQPLTPEGGQLDWSQTPFATRAAEGVLDGGGTTYALLKRENNAWRVVDHAIGPTDVAWVDWPTEHGAPASLFETP